MWWRVATGEWVKSFVKIGGWNIQLGGNISCECPLKKNNVDCLRKLQGRVWRDKANGKVVGYEDLEIIRV